MKVRLCEIFIVVGCAYGKFSTDDSGTKYPSDLSSRTGPLSIDTAERLHPGTCSGRLYFAGSTLGFINSPYGIPLFSTEGQRWIQSKTGQTGSFDKLYYLDPPSQRSRRVLPLNSPPGIKLSDPVIELPDRKLIEQYVSIYSSSPIRFIFPVIDPDLFKETLDSAYDPSPEKIHSSIVISAKGAVLAFLSFITIFGLDRSLPLPIDIRRCAETAQCYVLYTPAGVTIDHLQATIMLVSDRSELSD